MTSNQESSVCKTCGCTPVSNQASVKVSTEVPSCLKCIHCGELRTFNSCEHKRRFFLASYLNYVHARKLTQSELTFVKFMAHQITNIDVLCKIVYDNKGKLFGGFVRDFVVPRLESRGNSNHDNDSFIPNEDVDFRDIDVWVTSVEQKDQIVEALRKQNFLSENAKDIGPMNSEERKRSGYHHHFDLYRYCVEFGGDYGSTTLDIIVSEKFTVHDFSVNLLSYDGITLQAEAPRSYFERDIDVVFTTSAVLKHIKEKKAVVLPDFVDVIKSKDSHWNTRKFRFAERFKLVELVERENK